MTPEQELHLAKIKAHASELIDVKYRAGQERHGGDLFTLSAAQLADEAIYEAIDQMVYLITLKEKINQGQEGFDVRK